MGFSLSQTENVSDDVVDLIIHQLGIGHSLGFVQASVRCHQKLPERIGIDVLALSDRCK